MDKSVGMGAVGILQDVRYAARAIRRDPLFFLFATIVIGLGVGASTAVYSVMSPLLLRPLPFESPDRLALVENDLDLSFEAMAGYNAFFEQNSYNLVGSGQPERLVGVGVTQNFLDVLGVRPALGRNFEYEEGLWDGPDVVILTHAFWERNFGADRHHGGDVCRLD